jgi:hypothetical protein
VGIPKPLQPRVGGASDGPDEPVLAASLRTYRVSPSVALWVDRPGSCPPVEVRFVNDLGDVYARHWGERKGLR